KLQTGNPDLETGRGFFFLLPHARGKCTPSVNRTSPGLPLLAAQRPHYPSSFACRSGSHIPCICSLPPLRLCITAESEMRCRLFSEGKRAIGFPWLIIRAAFEESQPPVDPSSSSQGAV